MNVLALDPGPTQTGLALLTLEQGRPGRLDHGDHVASANVIPWLQHEVRRGSVRIDLVVIEQPAMAFGTTPQQVAARGIELLKTAWIGGDFARGARDLGLAVRRVEAGAWRYALCRDRAPKNATIATALGLLCTGIGRTNNHVRDAAGLGLMVGLGTCPSEVIR